MLPLIADRKVADVVYGSRFYGRPHRSLYFHHYLANRLISLLFNLLYNQMLSDIEVGYKMFSRDVLQNLKLTSGDFGFEIEISAQIARAKRWRIYEVGISYYGRWPQGARLSREVQDIMNPANHHTRPAGQDRLCLTSDDNQYERDINPHSGLMWFSCAPNPGIGIEQAGGRGARRSAAPDRRPWHGRSKQLPVFYRAGSAPLGSLLDRRLGLVFHVY